MLCAMQSTFASPRNASLVTLPSLLALALVPLVFQLPMEDQFALPKLCLLAALLGATIVLAPFVGIGRNIARPRLPLPMLAAIATLFAADVASVWFSIDRRTSILGVYQQYGGFSTEAINVGFFLIATAQQRATVDARFALWKPPVQC